MADAAHVLPSRPLPPHATARRAYAVVTRAKRLLAAHAGAPSPEWGIVRHGHETQQDVLVV
jgi:hypothetical protein